MPLPDPANLEPSAPKSSTSVHNGWGLAVLLVGIVVCCCPFATPTQFFLNGSVRQVFFAGLNNGLVVLGAGVGDTLPHAFTNFTLPDEHPGWTWIDFGTTHLHPEHEHLYPRPLGIFLVAAFAWLMAFGATVRAGRGRYVAVAFPIVDRFSMACLCSTPEI